MSCTETTISSLLLFFKLLFRYKKYRKLTKLSVKEHYILIYVLFILTEIKSPPIPPKQNTKDEQETQVKHRSIILGTLIAVSCIAIGLLVASVLFYRSKKHGKM